MNTNAVIAVVVAVVVIGGGAWFFTTHPGGVASAPDSTAQGSDQASSQSGSGTFAALIALGGSLQCQVQVPTGTGQSTGTVYVSGGQVRSDVEANANGKTMTAHMIKAGDTIYSWTDAYPQGVKLSLSAAQSKGSSQSGYNPNQQVQYSCTPWIADASKFAVPASVTFMDMTSVGTPGAAPAYPRPN